MCDEGKSIPLSPLWFPLHRPSSDDPAVVSTLVMRDPAEKLRRRSAAGAVLDPGMLAPWWSLIATAQFVVRGCL